jgi:hypothetical protein
MKRIEVIPTKNITTRLEMSTPAFLDNPLLKVSRPVAACSRCRTARIKCDGKLPVCSPCEKVGKASACSGASDAFAGKNERSYVASLEGFCERLERRLADMRQRNEMRVLPSSDGEQIHESSITSLAYTLTACTRCRQVR